MKRFDFYEDEEDDDDDFEEKSISPQEYKKILAEEQALQQETVELTYLALNQELLSKSIKFCEKSLFWNFYSVETQLKMISKIYMRFRDLQEY